MSVTALSIIVFFSLWLVATVINQPNYKWAKRLTGFDVLHILPRWTFFAPNPGTSDYHFVYRQMDEEGAISAFKEISLLNERSLIACFWNPDKRVKKALLDLSISMNQLIVTKEVNENNLRLTFPYVAFLNFLSKFSFDDKTNSVQFLILVSCGYMDYSDPKLIVCSDFHYV
jgi:hypothetical protein